MSFFGNTNRLAQILLSLMHYYPQQTYSILMDSGFFEGFVHDLLSYYFHLFIPTSEINKKVPSALHFHYALVVFWL